jgi:hypothetical protein
MAFLVALCALLTIIFVPSYEASHVADTKRFELEMKPEKPGARLL